MFFLFTVACSFKPEPTQQQALDWVQSSPEDITIFADEEKNNLMFLSIDLPENEEHTRKRVHLHKKGYRTIYCPKEPKQGITPSQVCFYYQWNAVPNQLKKWNTLIENPYAGVELDTPFKEKNKCGILHPITGAELTPANYECPSISWLWITGQREVRIYAEENPLLFMDGVTYLYNAKGWREFKDKKKVAKISDSTIKQKLARVSPISTSEIPSIFQGTWYERYNCRKILIAQDQISFASKSKNITYSVNAKHLLKGASTYIPDMDSNIYLHQLSDVNPEFGELEIGLDKKDELVFLTTVKNKTDDQPKRVSIHHAQKKNTCKKTKKRLKKPSSKVPETIPLQVKPEDFDAMQ